MLPILTVLVSRLQTNYVANAHEEFAGGGGGGHIDG